MTRRRVFALQPRRVALPQDWQFLDVGKPISEMTRSQPRKGHDVIRGRGQNQGF